MAAPTPGWFKARTTGVLVAALIGAGFSSCGSGAPETPANAAIDFGISWQTGEADDSADRVCGARRDEFADASSEFHRDLEATLGSLGLSNDGYPEEQLDDDTVLVYMTTGAPAPPPGEYMTPATPVFAYEMVREDGKWRVCGIRETDDEYLGFDVRMPCAPGETSDPEDPDGCRPR